MKILRLGSLFLLILGLSLRGAIAGETGHAVRDVDVRSEPRNDAPVTFKLAKGARYELLERKLSWARVSVGGREGWTLFYFLMSGEPPTPQSPGFAVSELWKFGSDRPSRAAASRPPLGPGDWMTPSWPPRASTPGSSSSWSR